jgi:hypothetical protein
VFFFNKNKKICSQWNYIQSQLDGMIEIEHEQICSASDLKFASVIVDDIKYLKTKRITINILYKTYCYFMASLWFFLDRCLIMMSLCSNFGVRQLILVCL